MIKTPESQYLPGITAFQNNRKKVCKFLLTYGVYFVIINKSSREIRQRREMRKCRNWQTSKTKDLVMLTSCGFKSHLPHETKGSTRKSWSFCFVRKGTLTQQLRCVGSGIHTRLGRTSSSVHPWLALGSKIPRQVLCSKSHLVNCWSHLGRFFLTYFCGVIGDGSF